MPKTKNQLETELTQKEKDILSALQEKSNGNELYTMFEDADFREKIALVSCIITKFRDLSKICSEYLELNNKLKSLA